MFTTRTCLKRSSQSEILDKETKSARLNMSDDDIGSHPDIGYMETGVDDVFETDRAPDPRSARYNLEDWNEWVSE